MKLLSLIPVALVAGCVDAEVEDVALDETAQDVTSTALQSHTCSTTPFCNINLGTASNRVCFLAGVRGGAALGNGSLVGVAPEGADWHLTIYPPNASTPLTITTVCVTPGTNVRTALWNTNFGVPSIQIPNTTASSRCFLSKFGGSNGGLTNYNDSIRTWRDASGKWFLGGSRQTGYLTGGAVCFDTTNQGEWSWGQGVSGSITGNLASNGIGGVACGLTELGGAFTTNSTSDGVHIGFSSNQWSWTLVNFKHAFANCIK